MHRLQKIAICLLFLGFFGAKTFAGLGPPPTIVVQPLDITVQNGGTAVFTVVASGGLLDAPTFTWFYNTNSQISQSSNITVQTINGLLGALLGDSESILTITHVNTNNAGIYSVKVKDSGGTTTSDYVLLSVLPPPVAVPIHILSPTAGLTAAGFNLSLSTPTSSNVVIEASSDLTNWVPIYTNLDSTGSISFMDTSATNYPYRYYRAHTQ